VFGDIMNSCMPIYWSEKRDEKERALDKLKERLTGNVTAQIVKNLLSKVESQYPV